MEEVKGGRASEDLLVLGAEHVLAALEGRDEEVRAAVARAYELHADGQSVVPHSVFVRPPGQARDRIIALPCLLGGGEPIAGVKWIASFPGNVARGMDRASAAILVSSLETGHPVALLEGSIISARRTAASAALAAQRMCRGAAGGCRIALVGAGPIQRETLRFVAGVTPIASATVLDLDAKRAGAFIESCARVHPNVSFSVARDLATAVKGAQIVSFATTAIEPHVSKDVVFEPGSTVLHVSLRDLPPEVVLRADNVVDDVDHALREGTSLSLAEKQVGHRRFVRTTIGDILHGRAPARASADGVSIFSPFGLGILDLAVCQVVLARARALGLGSRIPSFIPTT